MNSFSYGQKTALQKSALVSVLAFSFFAPAARADEAALRPLEQCFPSKDFVQARDQFDGLAPKDRDVIKVRFDAQLKVKDALPLPQRFYYKSPAGETDIAITPDGKIGDFFAGGKVAQDGVYCVVDPARAGRPASEKGINFLFDMTMAYPRQQDYPVSLLAEGLTEGRAHFKKLAGPAMSLLVPKLTHVLVGYETKNPAPQISAVKDGVAIAGLTPQPFGKTWVVELAQLEKLGASALRVSDNFKDIEPGASIATMRRFGFTEGDDASAPDASSGQASEPAPNP